MSRAGGVPVAPLVGVISGHEIVHKDPDGARRLNQAIMNHVTPQTQCSYASALKKYLKFCSCRKITPFPVDPVWIALYVTVVTTSISISSLNGYLAAIHNEQALRGFPWTIGKDEIVRRAIRYVKKVYRPPSKAPKIPISVALILKMVVHVPYWPDWARMCHNDRVFIAASVIASCGFLRGGEFLVYNGSCRGLLTHSMVSIDKVNGQDTVIVHVEAPKNMWWVEGARVMCFSPAIDSQVLIDPVIALRMYRRFSSVVFEDDGPAFVMSNGLPLSKKFMISIRIGKNT